MTNRVLFIGGSGQISHECVKQAVAAGHEVSVFNRGRRDEVLPAGVTSIVGELNDDAALSDLAARKFDVVCQFIGFKPEQVARDVAAFAGHCGRYVFISSASVYEKPASHYVISEQTPAVNPYWGYSQDKIACEQVLARSAGLDWTIVRPSHTVRTGLPTMTSEGDRLAQRMLDGQPVIVAGDGHTPWTLTRSADLAVPFVRLLTAEAASREVFHITADEGHTWNQIYAAIGAGLGVEPNIVHVPTDTLVRYNPDWEGPLVGDKAWTALFDNSKVKAVAGDFGCATDLETILAEPLRHCRARLAAGPVGAETEADALWDRIAAEQTALGA